ncbi:UTP--glucose-1-phosphate uridylyltransferase [Phaeovulum vinaykumarii]|uniref:UTP--glucose-1-phosphate uridylyltransferase n=1 Tax=Phaeovulum vinaykumarii TaxID=407234 RepID=A0A1N7LMY0_9RHOB|nr:sugar phosphate nucleotidyltransferase [Phaeovulum vinaykumarii]SIS75149.1 UTP--glucose-1-phosphate uridylyltransferase [Phaeovulum vinaykumarii]SOC05563.1 UTP--glucose-1-phosphate uridylyltransferase [Phaeovulum vinaykumarii]
MPVIDTPLIQFAIDEARAAGVERMVFVSHPSKSAIERHVRADHDLIATLHARGKSEIARDLHAAAVDETEHEVEFVMQHEPLGLGHAVLCARPHVLPGPVAVILPDDLILSDAGCLSEMVAAYDAGTAGHMVATMQVTPETVSRYGVLDPVSETDRLVHARGMVEKPAPEDAPSLHAVVGRYILDGSIFETLATQPPGAGGEIQLTDAIARDAGGMGLAGFVFSGRRFDCGSKRGMLEATLARAASHPELAGVLSGQGFGPAVQIAAE